MSKKEREDIKDSVARIFSRLCGIALGHRILEIQEIFRFLNVFREAVNIKDFFGFDLEDLNMPAEDFELLCNFVNNLERSIKIDCNPD